MAQYLDSTGLGTLVEKIKEKFYPKVNGNNDRSDINAILNGDKPLVTPEIVTSRWTVTKVDGSADNTAYSGNSITIPTGSSVQYTGTWKWTTTAGYKDPETVSGAWGSTKPASGTASAVCAVQSKTSTTVTDATIAQVTLTAAKKGLMLSGQKVVKASGNDNTSASAVVKFRECVYYGPVADATPSGTTIAALANPLLQSGRQATVTATTNTSQYFCYAYPKIFGELTSIVADGADPIKDNFRAAQTVSVTNKAGLAKDYYVYVSVNKGAFSNNSLAFK